MVRLDPEYVARPNLDAEFPSRDRIIHPALSVSGKLSCMTAKLDQADNNNAVKDYLTPCLLPERGTSGDQIESTHVTATATRGLT